MGGWSIPCYSTIPQKLLFALVSLHEHEIRLSDRAPIPGPGESLEIRRILCPLDFSEYSENAFNYASCLAQRFGARLFLQHTVESAQYVFLGGIGPEAIRAHPERQLQDARQAILRLLISAGVDSSDVTVLLNHGSVPGKILETVSSEPIDLVVMGTHGRKGVNNLLMGSVTEEIMHQAPCPVLAVRRPRRTVTPNRAEALDWRTIRGNEIG